MSLLHVSINAENPKNVAQFLSNVLGGKAFPFPPFPNSWIAFSEQDDGTAIEVYPTTHVLEPGADQVACKVGESNNDTTFAHAAIASKIDASEILNLAHKQGWTSRLCNRGPFECIEVWVENRLLLEILDPIMQSDYRQGMTISNWQSMFSD